MDACAVIWSGTEQSTDVLVREKQSEIVFNINLSELFFSRERSLMKSLDALSALHEDWDGYGAPSVSKIAIARSKTTLKAFDSSLYAGMTVEANEWGGIQLQYKFIGGLVCCDFGDDSMSYYIKWNSGKVELHSFEEYTESNIKSLGEILYNLA